MGNPVFLRYFFPNGNCLEVETGRSLSMMETPGETLVYLAWSGSVEASSEALAKLLLLGMEYKVLGEHLIVPDPRSSWDRITLYPGDCLRLFTPVHPTD